ELMDSVYEVLEEIKVENKNILVVFNKIDKVGGKHFLFLKKQLITKYPDCVFISAKYEKGLEELYKKVEEFVIKSKVTVTLEIPAELQNLISFIHDNAEIIDDYYNTESKVQSMKIKINRQLLPNIKKQIEDFNLKKELGI
ncbi:MAG: hypothetical protein KAU01_10530, partial [Candidatus Cloacimonetes bacterium]|nr:hypothetical protein [Candidatus Cloacimonadota bacterium]